MTPKLYLRPLNGLCNRMRAIASARALAADAGADLIVVWDVDEGLGARYEELFVGDSSFKVRNLAPGASAIDALLFLVFGEVDQIRGIPTKWVTRAVFGDRVLRNLRPEHRTDSELRELLRSERKLLISSWWTFYGGAGVDFTFFTPRPDEQAQIERLSEPFGGDTIGVHIRRTDNANAIRQSPTSAFIAAMKNAVDENSGVKFFLATDCEETEGQLKALFGKRVISRSRDKSRGSLHGMRDAIVDLFVLARTRLIYGSFYSTFSETAADIGGIRWLTVTDNADLVGSCNSEVLLVPRQVA
jgi:hypothetical protein